MCLCERVHEGVHVNVRKCTDVSSAFERLCILELSVGLRARACVIIYRAAV